MTIITYIILAVIYIKHSLLTAHGIKVNRQLTKTYGVLTLEVSKTSPASKLLTMTGGFLILSWGTVVPVIAYKEGNFNLPLYLHEVGHVSDVTEMHNNLKLLDRLFALVIQLIWCPLNLPTWLIKLATKNQSSENGSKIVVDAGFELRADAYAISVVGKDAFREAFLPILAGMLNVPTCTGIDNLLDTLKSIPAQPAVDILIQRLEVMK